MEDVHTIKIYKQRFNKHTPEFNEAFEDALFPRVLIHPWHLNDDLLSHIHSPEFRRHEVIFSDDLRTDVESRLASIRSRRRPVLKSWNNDGGEIEIMRIVCTKTFLLDKPEQFNQKVSRRSRRKTRSRRR